SRLVGGRARHAGDRAGRRAVALGGDAPGAPARRHAHTTRRRADARTAGGSVRAVGGLLRGGDARAASAMICLALSPAIDVTYRLGTMRPGEVNRVERVEARAGGKAVNVARVARALGASPTVVAPAGGADGRRLV